MTDQSIRQRITEALAARMSPHESWRDQCDQSEAGYRDFQRTDKMADLMEQVKNGASPILFHGEVPIHFPPLADTERGLEPNDPPRQTIILKAAVRLTRERVRDDFLQIILDEIADSHSGLVAMTVLPHFGHEFLLEVASEFLAQLLALNDFGPEQDVLPEFLVELHEIDRELIGRLIAATTVIYRQSGDRLRAMIVEAVDGPYCLDRLGYLGTAELIQALEE